MIIPRGAGSFQRAIFGATEDPRGDFIKLSTGFRFMKKKFRKRIWLTALIVVLAVMLIIGTSVVSAIAQNTTEKAKSAKSAAVSSVEKKNEKMLDSYVYNAAHNRSKWLCDLMNLSGLANIKNSSDGKLIYQKAIEKGLISAGSEREMVLPLNRLFVAQTTVKALGYPERSVGQLADITKSQKAMDTMAYYGWFIPDDRNKVYPNARISSEEYEGLLTQLNRYRTLKGKKVLAFGDSIMYGSGNNDEGIADLIATKYGMKVMDYSVPGASFGDRVDRSRICNQIRVADSKNEKADIILLNGGTNDMGRTPFGEMAEGFDMSETKEISFTDGFQKALWMLKTNWKGVPIVYTRVHNMDWDEDRIERQYGERALDIADKWQIKSVNLYNGTMMNTEIKAICDRYTFVDERYGPEHDSIHPNALGYAKYYLPLISEAVMSQFSEE